MLKNIIAISLCAMCLIGCSKTTSIKVEENKKDILYDDKKVRAKHKNLSVISIKCNNIDFIG